MDVVVCVKHQLLKTSAWRLYRLHLAALLSLHQTVGLIGCMSIRIWCHDCSPDRLTTMSSLFTYTLNSKQCSFCDSDPNQEILS